MHDKAISKEEYTRRQSLETAYLYDGVTLQYKVQDGEWIDYGPCVRPGFCIQYNRIANLFSSDMKFRLK